MNGVRWGKVLLIPMVALWGLGAQCGGTGTGPEIKTVRLSPVFVYKRVINPVRDLFPGEREIANFCFSINSFDFGNAICWDRGIEKINNNTWRLDPGESYLFSTEFFSWVYAFDARMCESDDKSCSCLEGNIEIQFKEGGWDVDREIVENISCDLPNSILKFRPKMR